MRSRPVDRECKRADPPGHRCGRVRRHHRHRDAGGRGRGRSSGGDSPTRVRRGREAHQDPLDAYPPSPIAGLHPRARAHLGIDFPEGGQTTRAWVLPPPSPPSPPPKPAGALPAGSLVVWAADLHRKAAATGVVHKVESPASHPRAAPGDRPAALSPPPEKVPSPLRGVVPPDKVH